MGTASDELFDLAMREEEARLTLIEVCESEDRTRCDWFLNDDGLHECRACGQVVDL